MLNNLKVICGGFVVVLKAERILEEKKGWEEKMVVQQKFVGVAGSHRKAAWPASFLRRQRGESRFRSNSPSSPSSPPLSSLLPGLLTYFDASLSGHPGTTFSRYFQSSLASCGLSLGDWSTRCRVDKRGRFAVRQSQLSQGWVERLARWEQW
ncbi:hypothetical protein DL98DRAFT_30960 [Cadophora sp. DSE1049]|nr:hypothetical protein DL98DRAFT_30960 [Cadophora sp. DSE1049]